MIYRIEIIGHNEEEPVELDARSHLYVRTKEDYDRVLARLNNLLAEEFEQMYPFAPIIRTAQQPKEG